MIRHLEIYEPVQLLVPRFHISIPHYLQDGQGQTAYSSQMLSKSVSHVQRRPKVNIRIKVIRT